MQGAGHSWQQEVSPLAPLGVSATQESDSGVPQSESEYKGLDELLGKAKRDRVGHRNGGAKTCAVYPDGIPWEYRRKVKGRPDERDTTPDCPEYQQTTNPQRWMTPEWRQIMQDLEREVERDRERGK